jgi:cobalamin biosynthesis Mg chelatase CobN
MTVAKPICAICLAVALAAPSSALASPAGSEYLPQVPKSSKGDADRSPSESGGSTSTESSSGAPTVTDSSSSYTGSSDSADSSDGGESPAKKQRPKERDEPKAETTPVKLAPVSADSAGSSDLLPVALLLGVGAVILLAGALVRRQHVRRLVDPARGTAR